VEPISLILTSQRGFHEDGAFQSLSCPYDRLKLESDRINLEKLDTVSSVRSVPKSDSAYEISTRILSCAVQYHRRIHLTPLGLKLCIQQRTFYPYVIDGHESIPHPFFVDAF
jgi:hypothetical protein